MKKNIKKKFNEPEKTGEINKNKLKNNKLNKNNLILDKKIEKLSLINADDFAFKNLREREFQIYEIVCQNMKDAF